MRRRLPRDFRFRYIAPMVEILRAAMKKYVKLWIESEVASRSRKSRAGMRKDGFIRFILEDKTRTVTAIIKSGTIRENTHNVSRTERL
jgi:hypothetical protein